MRNTPHGDFILYLSFCEEKKYIHITVYIHLLNSQILDHIHKTQIF